MQLSEFEELLKFLEPSVSKKNIINLFKEALSMADDDAENDAISPEILMRQILHHKIGGYGKEFFGKYLKKRKAKFTEKNKNKKKWRFSTRDDVIFKFVLKIFHLDWIYGGLW